MDVRCEKCQTEYELDESRLKPGGVTVKCTNCGHMFKIRKRAATNVGVPASAASAASSGPTRVEPAPAPPPAKRPESQPVESSVIDSPSGPMTASAGERQWLVRLENGEQKTCKELATLQQWIVAGVVSRESLISRSGKTWKRLGDITELTQYFVIADESRAARGAEQPTAKQRPVIGAGTVLGMGGSQRESDEDLERRTTGAFQRPPRKPTPPPPPPVAAPKPAPAAAAPPVNPVGQTELAPSGPIPSQPKRPPTEPPPPPKAKPAPIPVPPGRGTAVWAQGDIKATDSMVSMPQGPRGGKLSTVPDDAGFGGKVRMHGNDEPFNSASMSRAGDDDEDMYPARRGSRAGMWIALLSLLVIGAAAGVVYMFVFKQKAQVASPVAPKDAAVAADAMSMIVVTPIDAGVETAADPLAGARAELLAGVNARMKTALEGLTGKDDPASLAMRARLSTALAQSMQDRALFVDKSEGDKLRKSAKQMVVDTAPLAQRAFNGQQDSASANLAMADVMRLQGKPAPAVKRYIDGARAKTGTDPELLASVALSDALLAIRDGNLPSADKALAAIDSPDDMRMKMARAHIAYAQNKPADAKSLVDQILATQPDHDVALALYKKLETVVAKDDPLPPEDGSAGKTPTNPTNPTNTTNSGGGGGGGGGGDYDSLLAKANKLAETSCAKAMDLFSKALEQKPNGVEALTGMGYCHLDAKQFSSAFSKFRAALFVSSRYEPALGGVAETYQRQGNKEAAIEAWKKYLEVYPGSAKAKKQLEILGASEGGGTTTPEKKPDGGEKKPEGGEGSAAPPPPPPPAPAPEGSAAG